jgi:hypothetical protein
MLAPLPSPPFPSTSIPHFTYTQISLCLIHRQLFMHDIAMRPKMPLVFTRPRHRNRDTNHSANGVGAWNASRRFHYSEERIKLSAWKLSSSTFFLLLYLLRIVNIGLELNSGATSKSHNCSLQSIALSLFHNYSLWVCCPLLILGYRLPTENVLLPGFLNCPLPQPQHHLTHNVVTNFIFWRLFLSLGTPQQLLLLELRPMTKFWSSVQYLFFGNLSCNEL